MKRHLICCLAAFGLLTFVRPAAAHFPWLAIGDDGKAVYFFGENPADRTYKMPAPIAKAEVRAIGADGQAKKIDLAGVERDDLVGLASAGAVAADATLVSQVTYGIYQGSRLDYYTIHHGGKLATSFDAAEPQKPPLDFCAKLVDTDSGVDVYVLWKGKPLAGAEVHLYCDEGHEEGNSKTDESGKVSFNDKEVEDGLNGIMVGHTVKDQPGELNGQAHQSASHYLTVTFVDPQTEAKDK